MCFSVINVGIYLEYENKGIAILANALAVRRVIGLAKHHAFLNKKIHS